MLSAGFGAGVAVMAILLGVAEVVLEQAQSPALVGGGDVLIRMTPQVPARTAARGHAAGRTRSEAASPAPRRRTAPDLYLCTTGDDACRVADAAGFRASSARSAIARAAAWRRGAIAEGDRAWTRDTPAKGLRQIDRFQPIPDAPDWARFVGRVALLQRRDPTPRAST